MNESDKINTRELLTLVQIPLHTIFAALVVLVFVSVVSASLAGADSVAPRAGIRQTIESDNDLIDRPAPNTVSVAEQITMRELCKALGPGHPTYPCYSEPKISSNNFHYGFHTGRGHGKQAGKDYFVTLGPQRYFLTLDNGRQYSVDRCALAHDSFYWSREDRDNKINDFNFYRCIGMVVPPDLDPNERLARTMVLTYGIPSIPRILEKLGGWRELPQSAIDIPADRNSTPREIISEIKPPKRATRTASAACGDKYSGSFLDPRKGGECWQCPAGYNRTGLSFGKGVPAVTDKNACVKGEIAGFGGTFTSAKYKGRPGCPWGSFEHGVTANCFSCPSGYKRNPDLNLSLEVDLTKVPDACIAN